MKPTGVTFLPQFHLNFLFERFYSWHSIQYMYKYSVTKVLKVPPKAICCYCSSEMELHVLPKNTMCQFEPKMCKKGGGPFSCASLKYFWRILVHYFLGSKCPIVPTLKTFSWRFSEVLLDFIAFAYGIRSLTMSWTNTWKWCYWADYDG